MKSSLAPSPRCSRHLDPHDPRNIEPSRPRRDPHQAALRLIGCSAEAAAETRAAALAAGMHEFLAKPVALSALARALAPSAPTITPPAADTSHDIFARLATPTTLTRARATLRAEWPRLRTTTETALAASDRDALRRLAHYLQSTALLLDDSRLLELCARLSATAASDSGEYSRALLAAVASHINSWPHSPSPS